MATTYPYISSAGPVVKTVERFRKTFPADVTAETLRKLGIAPKNESYVINILKFLELIDDAGKRVQDNTKSFLQHDDGKFAEQFGETVKSAYAALFDLYGDEAWTQERETLVTFFRTADNSSDLVGKRQALTFNALAALSGHGEMFVPRTTTSAPKSPSAPKKTPVKAAANPSNLKVEIPADVDANGGNGQSSRVGLTVRIEVNLPANGDQDTYDAIFKSIRKNLIDDVERS